MDSRRPPVAIPAAYLAAGNLPSGNGYGAQRAGGVMHWGLDIANPVGADVDAPEAGTVARVWTDNVTAPFVGYGPGGVLLQGASGLFHLLAHMNPAVRVGDVVGVGDLVGHTGKLDVASHCHWEVRVKPIDSPETRKGNTMNPIDWLRGASSSSSGLGWVLALVVLAIVSRRR